ncbi:MAG: tetratricopeptide repeat protein [Anaerolineae bacterium]
MVVEVESRTRPALPGGIDPLQLVSARDFDRLVILLTHAERGAWAFCLYNTAPVRDAVVEALRVRLDPLPVCEFTLSPQEPNPRDYLRKLPPGAAHRRAVIVFYDAWRAFDSGFFGYLDLQREQFMRVPHSLVFWVRGADRAAIARYAPNFFSRHAGIFDFQVAVPEQAQAARDFWSAEPIGWDTVEERERQERLYVNLLAEYEADEEPDQATIADLLGKLARIWYYSADYDQAEEALERRLEIVQSLGDQAGQADSLFYLGLISARRYEHDAALASYGQALELFRAVGARLGEANMLQAIGDVQQFRKEVDAALASYGQALELFRAVGARLGEANISLAFGRLTRQQGDFEAARRHGQTALAVYRTMDNAWNVALALWDLARVERDDDNLSAARSYYEQALMLLERIGAPAAAIVREELQEVEQDA